MQEKINKPHLTAKRRSVLSFSSSFLHEHGLLKGEILDFGCGYGKDVLELKKMNYKILGFDNYYQPEYPIRKFDTILCNYVLDIVEYDIQKDILMSVSELLKPTGRAYFTVKRGVNQDQYLPTGFENEYTYQCNINLPFNSIYLDSIREVYEYQHYNTIIRAGAICPFCAIDQNTKLLTETDTVIAVYDNFPVSNGHILVVPKRHVSNYFDLSIAEQKDLLYVINHCKLILDHNYNPDGYNIGVNVGVPGGQSIPHVHIHLIPRYKGDMKHPKGGVRGVIPSKQNY